MQDDNKDKNKLPDNSPAKNSPSDSSEPKKKENFIVRGWKAWCEWWKLTWESYRVEVEDRILMSWKRIIKFCGITIIPILYGVICSIAMWNPVEALGKATTYVMDDDYSVLLVTDSNNKDTNKFSFGAVSYFNDENGFDDENAPITKEDVTSILTGSTADAKAKKMGSTGLKASDIVFDKTTGTIGIENSAIKNDVERNKMAAIIFQNVMKDNLGHAEFHLADAIPADADGKGEQAATSVTYDPSDAGFSFKITSMWDVVKNAFYPKKDANVADNKYKFSAPAFLTHPEVSLQNVHYSTDKKWNDKWYQHRKGWIQAKIPTGYMAKVINFVALEMKKADLKAQNNPNNQDAINALQQQGNEMVATMQPLGLWTTYQRNFLFGYMFDMMSGLLGQYMAMQLPSTLNTAAVSNLSDYLSTDAPTIAALTGNLDKMSDAQDKRMIYKDKDIDLSQRYVLSDSSSLSKISSTVKNTDMAKSASLFGDISSTDQGANAVGGKFIDTIQTAKNLVDNVALQGVLGILGGTSLTSGVKQIVNSIQGLIDNIINAINGDTAKFTPADGKNPATVDYSLKNVTITDGKTDPEDLAKLFNVTDDSTNKAVDQKTITYSMDSPADGAVTGSKVGTLNVSVNMGNITKKPTIQWHLNVADPSKASVSWSEPITIGTKKSGTQANVIRGSTQLDINPTPVTDADAALAELNRAVYDITTGQKMTDYGDINKVNTVIQQIWKALGKTTPAPDLGTISQMSDIAIFRGNDGTVDQILSETDFQKRADKFVKANSSDFWGAQSVNDVLPKLLANKTADTFFKISLGDNIVTYKIQGAEFGYEGIGIGLFFLTVGLYVGAMLHSFIFDRAKRLQRAKWSNWYLSKTFLMLTIGFFQVTAEVWIVYAGGWHAIGATAMCYVWLWLLASDTMFIVIIQALWFSLKDEIIGKFLMVIVLVTSIAAGGGEFPAFSEFGFYHGISYIVPFTYVINGFDTITFAISLNGTHTDTTQYMFAQWGAEWVYVAIFQTFGMIIGSQLRMKEMNYGSHYGFAVAGAMRALGKDASTFQVLRKVTRKGRKRYYYNWKALPDSFMPELYFQCRKMYKFAGEFKWWQRKHHDFVQKPNYSDEEVIQRNE